MAQIGSPEEARRIVNYWADEGRDLVQGLHRHQPRGAARRDRRGPQARAEVHRPPLLGLVPRGRAPRHRQPRARSVHQQRLRAEPDAGSLLARDAHQPAEGGHRRARGAADDPRDGEEQGGDVVDARGLRAVVSRIARRSRIACSTALAPEAREEYLERAQGNVGARRAVDDAGAVPPRAGVRARVREGRRPARLPASIPPAWAARFRASATSATSSC